MWESRKPRRAQIAEQGAVSAEEGPLCATCARNASTYAVLPTLQSYIPCATHSAALHALRYLFYT